MSLTTIIIPFTNEFDFLREALACAVAQDGIEKEILVVCNAPTTPSGYEQLATQWKDCRMLHEPRSGSAYARNYGLHVAKGEWIQFLDVDDLLMANKILNQLSFHDADVVVSPHLFQFLNGKKEKSKWLAQDVWEGLLNSGLGSTSSMLWKKAAVESAGGWNPEYSSHQEYELLFRLMQTGKRIATLDRTDTIVRERKSGSITKNTKSVRGIEGVNLRELMWMHLQQAEMETPTRQDAFHQYIFRQLRGLFRLNAKETMEKYREHIHKKNFTPKEINVPVYSFLYKLLGFYWTERFIGLWVWIRGDKANRQLR